MSFDFFNTSYLAFGSKLYAAFVTLENLIMEAEDNLEQVKSDQAIYDEYLNKNYQSTQFLKYDWIDRLSDRMYI